MLKMVISDYRMDLKRIVKESKAVDWTVRLMVAEYFCFMLTIYSNGKLLGHGRQKVWSMVLYILIVISLGMGSFHSNRLGKMFYLLPVSQQDRRNYLLAGYWFRILLAVLAVGSCTVVGVVFVGVPLLQGALILGHFFMVMCIVHAYSNTPWETGEKNPVQWQYRVTYAEFMIFQNWDSQRHMRWRYYLSCICGVGGVFLIVLTVTGKYRHWAFALVTVVQAAVVAMLCASYWKDDKRFS